MSRGLKVIIFAIALYFISRTMAFAVYYTFKEGIGIEILGSIVGILYDIFYWPYIPFNLLVFAFFLRSLLTRKKEWYYYIPWKILVSSIIVIEMTAFTIQQLYSIDHKRRSLLDYFGYDSDVLWYYFILGHLSFMIMTSIVWHYCLVDKILTNKENE